MSDPELPVPPRRYSRWAWALLITVPAGLFVSGILWFAASLSLCGVFGCTKAAYGPNYEWIVPLLLAGLVMTVATAAPPWCKPHWQRWLVFGVGFGLLTLANLVWFALDKYSNM